MVGQVIFFNLQNLNSLLSVIPSGVNSTSDAGMYTSKPPSWPAGVREIP